jgi:hypothetical protein
MRKLSFVIALTASTLLACPANAQSNTFAQFDRDNNGSVT